MKISIFTLFRDNYGAILQAYSLQKKLRELGSDKGRLDRDCLDRDCLDRDCLDRDCLDRDCLDKDRSDNEVRIVDFKTDYHAAYSNIFRKRSENCIKDAVWKLLAALRYKQLKQRIKSIAEFHRAEFSFTKQYNTEEQLINDPPESDVYLSGSDQVFNPRKEYSNVYLLGFNKKNAKKVAYAPSFGISDFTKAEKEYLGGRLKDFDYLSCREESGARFMSDLLKRDVPVVLDPVFLTEPQKWRDISTKPPFREKYIFVYTITKTEKVLDIAQRLNRDTKYKIVLLSPSDLRLYSKCEHIYYPGPKEFLGLIDNAEYVITDSFHATSFSVILHKNFYTYITNPTESSRIMTLLSSLSLLDHIIQGQPQAQGQQCRLCEHQKSHTLGQQSWNCEEQLNLLRQKSLDYLSSILK